MSGGSPADSAWQGGTIGGPVGAIIGGGIGAILGARGGPGFSNSTFLKSFIREGFGQIFKNRPTPQAGGAVVPYVPPAPPVPYIPPSGPILPGAPGGPISASAWQAIIEKAQRESAQLMQDVAAEKAKKAAEKAARKEAKRKAQEARQKKIDEQKARAEAILAKRAQIIVPRGGSRGAVGRGRAPWEPKVNAPSSPPGGGAAGAPPITVIVNIPGTGTTSGSSGQPRAKDEKLEEIKIHAKYKMLPNRKIKIATLPKTAPAPAGVLGKYPILASILKYGSILAPLSSLVFPVGAPRQRRRDALTPLTPDQPAALPLAQSYPVFGGTTPTKTKTCECKSKKRKKGPKKRRNVCYRGTYYETPTGTRKRKREQIPCEATT